jgi:hypothetical protein
VTRELPPLRRLARDRCGVCGERETDRDFLPLDDVVYSNGLKVPACATCWMRWPNEHKHRAGDPSRFSELRTVEILQLFREAVAEKRVA